jgi:hypothetical protein
MPAGTGTHYAGPVHSEGGFFAAGVPILPAGIPFHSGSYLWVQSTNAYASDSNSGLDRTRPLATVDAAIGKATANNDDAIILLPGHAEAVTATSIALDVAGVSIYGVGNGLKRPTFTYGATDSTITVSAANCKWQGCHFIGALDNVVTAFTIGAAKDFRLVNNTFRDNSAALHFLAIVTTGATNNAADGLTLIGNEWHGLAVAPGPFLSVLGNLSFLKVLGNYVCMASTDDEGSFMTLSSKVLLQAEIGWNKHIVVGSTGAAVGIFLTGSATTCTGIVHNNYVSSLDTTAELIATAGTGLSYFANLYTGEADLSGKVWPLATAT